MMRITAAFTRFILLLARRKPALSANERAVHDAVAESEARFRSIFDLAAVGINVTSESGRYLMVNQRMVDLLGYTREELLERDFRSVTLPADIAEGDKLTADLAAGIVGSFRLEKRYVRKDGAIVHAEIFVRSFDTAPGQPRRFICVALDVSERKLAEERIRMLTAGLESQVAERTGQLHEMIRAGQRRNEELSLITEMGGLLAASSDSGEAAQVVVRYLPKIFPQAEGAFYLQGAAGAILERKVHWGPGGAGLASFSAEDCWALRRGEIHHTEGEADALRCPHVAAERLTHPHVCVPVLVLGQGAGIIELGWGRAADGWAPELAVVKTVADKIGLAIGNLRLREELSRQALVDPLTGLHNRRWLEMLLRRKVAEHARSGAGFSVLMIDVDHFKSINDRFGHEAGDRALREVSGVLSRCTRVGESPVRFGGEEFVLVIATEQRDEALIVAERIRSAIQSLRVLTRGAALPAMSVSIGIATYPLHGADEAAVLQRADAALYEAKRSGRNQVRVSGVGLTAIKPANLARED